MTIVADTWPHVIGVDTHAKNHAYAVVETTTGKLVAEREFPATKKGHQRAITWMRKHAPHGFATAVECTGSYGRSLAIALHDADLTVFEVRPPARGSRARHGKTDALDALAAARGILGADTSQLATPRTGDVREALHERLTARNAMRSDQTRVRNQLNAAARRVDIDIDARSKLSDRTVREIADWTPRHNDTLGQAAAREEAIRLAKRWVELEALLKQNEHHLRKLIKQLAPSLLDMFGVGPFSAAVILDVYSHHGRIRNEAAFARIAGVAPIPVYSGNTGRHRLSRTDNRQLNSALYAIAHSRSIFDPTTKDFIKRAITNGKTRREALRTLKRYIARAIFRHLETIMTT